MSAKHEVIEFRGAAVIIEYETTDPDVLPFLAVRVDEETRVAWYTANELRKLADKMDVWQNMNSEGAA